MDKHKNSNALDWRIQAAVTTATDVPSAYPGGPSHPAGSVMVLTSEIDTPTGKVAIFAPSAVALALSIAAKSAVKAREERAKLLTAVIPSPAGKTTLISSTRELFDYFEHCFVTTTFAYQAVEAFCNFKIGYGYVAPLQIPRGKGTQEMPREELERLALREKLASVLPMLLSRTSPKGTLVWQRFVELEDVRDSLVHLKSHHQWQGATSFDDSPYVQYVNLEPTNLLRAGIQMIEHYAGEHEGEWITSAKMIIDDGASS
jgi:hypothetical protein